MKLERTQRAVEFLIVARNERDGFEEVFRTDKISGLGPERIGRAIASGELLEGCRWRKVPVKYRVVTKKGQELWCRWVADKKGFVSEIGGLILDRSWCETIEEFVCSE